MTYSMKKIVILMLLLALAVSLTVAFASCTCGGDEAPAVISTDAANTDTAPTTTVDSNPLLTTQQKTEDTTVASESTQPASSTAKAPETTVVTPLDSSAQPSTGKLPAEPIAPSTNKADESGKIALVDGAVKSGLLLTIDAEHAYDLNEHTLFQGDENMTAEEAIRRGYTHISTMFKTVDNSHFLRNEAIAALAALIQTFDSVAGTDKPFLVEGYSKSSADVTNAFVTGNVLKLRIFENNATYGLNYTGYQVSLNGEMVTYDKWFEATAAKYGFIYEGLVGDENNAAGQLRYVGTIHSMGIKEAGSLKAYIDAIKAGTVTSVTVGEDTWKLSYVKFSQSDSIGHYTVVLVGANATYTISGDNKEGLIVAVKVETTK